MMDKYKYQILAFIVAILIGSLLGHLGTNSSKNKEIVKLNERHNLELKREISLSQNRIKQIDSLLVQKQQKSIKDSILIIGLKQDLITNTTHTTQSRREVAKLSLSGKGKWLIARYDSSSRKLPQLELKLPEYAVDSIADELVVKDGLIIEISTLRKEIVIYEDQLNNEKSKVLLLTIKGQEYEKIISNKDKLYESIQAELKDKKKENMKLKIKNVLLSLGVAVETVVLILLLL